MQGPVPVSLDVLDTATDWIQVANRPRNESAGGHICKSSNQPLARRAARQAHMIGMVLFLGVFLSECLRRPTFEASCRSPGFESPYSDWRYSKCCVTGGFTCLSNRSSKQPGHACRPYRSRRSMTRWRRFAVPASPGGSSRPEVPRSSKPEWRTITTTSSAVRAGPSPTSTVWSARLHASNRHRRRTDS